MLTRDGPGLGSTHFRVLARPGCDRQEKYSRSFGGDLPCSSGSQILKGIHVIAGYLPPLSMLVQILQEADHELGLEVWVVYWGSDVCGRWRRGSRLGGVPKIEMQVG